MVTAKRVFPFVLLMLIAFALRGTSQTPDPQTHPMDMQMGMMSITRAVAVLNPASGSQVHGTVTFEKVSDGIKVTADVQGLAPGQHGIHVHQFGDCSSMDATSAGDHFNPSHMSHGAPTDKSRHEGDMGNLTAGSDGHAHLEWTDPMMSFMGPQSIIGHSVIIHANADDMKTQPSGNAGPRIACGVIGIAK